MNNLSHDSYKSAHFFYPQRSYIYILFFLLNPLMLTIFFGNSLLFTIQQYYAQIFNMYTISIIIQWSFWSNYILSNHKGYRDIKEYMPK